MELHTIFIHLFMYKLILLRFFLFLFDPANKFL